MKKDQHWYVTPGGSVRVIVKRLLANPRVRSDIQRMKELFMRYGKKK